MPSPPVHHQPLATRRPKKPVERPIKDDALRAFAALDDPEGVLSAEEIEEKLDRLRGMKAPEGGWRSVHYVWRTDYPSGTYTAEDVAAMLPLLSQGQVTYAAARVRGNSRRLAARIVQVSTELARTWEESPWYEALCERERARLFGDATAAFSPLAPLMLETYERALKGELGPDAAVSVAKDVADRVYGKPAQTIKQEGGGDSLVRDLTAFLREVNAANDQLRAEQRAALTSGAGAGGPVDGEVVEGQWSEQSTETAAPDSPTSASS